MSKYRSRNTAYSQKAVPRQKRTTLLYGEGEYQGRFYKCWNCGFVNDKDQAVVADTYQGGDSSAVEEFDTAPAPYGTGDTSFLLTLNTTFDTMTLMPVDANGNIVEINQPRRVVITGGCAFCGSYNWR